jgi:hypothetical protein
MRIMPSAAAVQRAIDGLKADDPIDAGLREALLTIKRMRAARPRLPRNSRVSASSPRPAMTAPGRTREPTNIGQRTMNAWNKIAQSTIEGELLQCRKGEWSADDKPVKVGRDGIRIVLLMDTTVVGEVSFDDNGNKVGERVGRIEDGFVPPEKLSPGFDPSTMIVGVGYSADARGRMLTFRSSSWGGRHALTALANTYLRFNEHMFPVVYLETTKTTRGGNVVIDPLFVVDRWLPRRDFATAGSDTLPAPEPTASEPAKLTDEAIERTGFRESAASKAYLQPLADVHMEHGPDGAFAGVDPDDLIR